MKTEKRVVARYLGRRAFLKSGVLTLTCAGVDPLSVRAEPQQSALTVGLVTDLHYADKPAAGSRYYRETLDKLAEASELLQQRSPQFIVELGDLVDAADSVKTELGYLTRVNQVFATAGKQRYYVLGNHCVHTLTKQEFLDGVEQPKSYFSFDKGDFHFVVLDACFRSDEQPYGRQNFEWTDANIPKSEIAWLKADLKHTNKKTIVFAHQRLDVNNHYGIRNATEIRQLLETSTNVLAVLQGHSHKNDYTEINGIHYCTLSAMIEGSGLENSGYAVMQISDNGTLRIEGFRKQSSYAWG